MKKQWKDYANRDYLVVIPSKGRSKHIEGVEELFPNAVLFVNEEEFKDYEKSKLNIVTHNRIGGYADVFNGIIENCNRHKIRYVAIMDDDKWKFVSLVGNRERHFSPAAIEQVIAQACQVLEDLDLPVYLFSTVSSIIKYSQAQPYSVGFSLPQGALVVRTDLPIRMRTGMHYYEDFDWSMEIIKRYRYMVICNRFLCISKGSDNVGGCNAFRTAARMKSAHDFILKKWGSNHVHFARNSSGSIKPVCRVKRKNLR